jgi:hypothetical protein
MCAEVNVLMHQMKFHLSSLSRDREIASGFVGIFAPSSFILHPSSFLNTLPLRSPGEWFRASHRRDHPGR